MKNKTANLDLFHDMMPAEPKPDRDQETKSAINNISPEGISAEQNLNRKQEQKTKTVKSQHTPKTIPAEQDSEKKEKQKTEPAERQHTFVTMSTEKDLDQDEEPEQEHDWEQDTDQDQEQENKSVKNIYPPMNIFPQAIAMMLPVWVYFCPGFPFGMPVMVLRPIIINPPVYNQN